MQPLRYASAWVIQCNPSPSGARARRLWWSGLHGFIWPCLPVTQCMTASQQLNYFPGTLYRTQERGAGGIHYYCHGGLVTSRCLIGPHEMDKHFAWPHVLLNACLPACHGTLVDNLTCRCPSHQRIP